MADITRRQAVTVLGALAAGSAALPSLAHARGGAEAPRTAGRLKHSVSRWCYGRIPLDDLCVAAKAMGYRSIELLSEPDWATPRKYGMDCAMANGFGSIAVGFNRPNQHDRLVADAERMIPLAAAAQIPNIVCFSGNRAGM